MCILERVILILLLGLWGAGVVWADGDKAEKEGKEVVAEEEAETGEEEEEEDKGPKFAEVIEDFEKIEGLFDLYRDPEENKVFLAIRPEQFGQLHLCNITRTQGDGYFFDSASLIYIGRGRSVPFAFERVGKKVFFTHKNVYYRADEDAAIHQAVDRGLSDSILGVGAIEGQPHPETGAVLVDPSAFFVQDIALVGFIFSEYIKSVVYSFDGDNSYFGALQNFPDNTEIDVVLHFKTGAPKMDIPTLADERSFQHVYHYSLSSLPESDFRPRLADDRVGHFTTLHQDYTSVLKDDPYVRYVNRWQLEKAEPKFKRSPPKEPIVYWLENTIPVEYRDAVREGVLVWNKAFDKLGFEEAIVVEQQPDDADWDAGDVRYSTIRWMVQPGRGYAVGPSRTNPFSGEIIDADIRISADFVRSVYREFTELVDPVGGGRQAVGDSVSAAIGLSGDYRRGFCDMADGLMQEAAFGWNVLEARTGSQVDVEEFIRQLTVQLVAHEVGHTLGLRHNFKASTLHSIDQLHDRSITDKEGISSSVMDYNPVNIAPEGLEQGEYYQTTLGPYDYWAIEYAYSPVAADSPQSERAQLEKIAGRVAADELAYGTDEDAVYWTRGIDPTATRWDLRDDPIAHYRDLVVLSRQLWDKVEDKFERKGERYQTLRRVFGWGFRPYYSGVGNISRYIGGIHHYRDHVGDPDGRIPLQPVAPARQREALDFLVEHVFGPNAFSWSPELLNKLAPERWPDFTWSIDRVRRIDLPVHDIVLGIQRQPLDRFYDPILLSRLQDLELRYEVGETFTMVDLFAGLRQAIWAELDGGGHIDSFRRNLQRAHLQKLLGLLLKPAAGTPEDARSLGRADLRVLVEQIGRRLEGGGLDAYSRAHLEETQARIEAGLQAGLERSL
ncbi:MAG: DUF5117 domain-containing protein [Candidatus Latescibacteria bacterium]|nr:DUF5117 domain-containing protein [Candidatus Latescibacterota bacterium]